MAAAAVWFAFVRRPCMGRAGSTRHVSWAGAETAQVHACQVMGVLPSEGLLVGLVAVPGVF
jgi:hypothetical protein